MFFLKHRVVANKNQAVLCLRKSAFRFSVASACQRRSLQKFHEILVFLVAETSVCIEIETSVCTGTVRMESICFPHEDSTKKCFCSGSKIQDYLASGFCSATRESKMLLTKHVVRHTKMHWKSRGIWRDSNSISIYAEDQTTATRCT